MQCITILLQAPSLEGQNATPPGYNEFVGREMGKAKVLLRVILSPVESVADIYRALIPKGMDADF